LIFTKFQVPEIAPNIGLADAIVDIVSSGSTYFKNNLKKLKLFIKVKQY
jgi:ATP phosphoribosyltransferase